jgi:signal transduction histidine kinase
MIILFLEACEEAMSPIEIAGVLNGVIEALPRMENLFAGIEVQRSFTDQLPPVIAGKIGLWQIAINILKNAAIHGKPNQITVSARQEDEYVVIQISDNGCGIPPENLERVPLEPGSSEMVARVISKGFTTGGTSGRGLYISYKIIKRFGGSMEVASTVGEGTTFRVRLKVAA